MSRCSKPISRSADAGSAERSCLLYTCSTYASSVFWLFQLSPSIHLPNQLATSSRSLDLQFATAGPYRELTPIIFNPSSGVCEGAVSALQCSIIHMKRFSAAGCAWAVFLVCLLAHEADCGTTFILGGEGVGWTNTANIDYNKWLSNYKIKIGDTLSFINYDTIEHSVVSVDKLGYDTCLEQGEKLSIVTTIGPGISYWFTYSGSGQGYVICDNPGHCVQGMKAFVQVLNADGSVNQTAAAANSPKANSASTMPGFSWTSQLLIVLVATVTLVHGCIPMFLR